jgi:hypothetical protein
MVQIASKAVRPAWIGGLKPWFHRYRATPFNHERQITCRLGLTEIECFAVVTAKAGDSNGCVSDHKWLYLGSRASSGRRGSLCANYHLGWVTLYGRP